MNDPKVADIKLIGIDFGGTRIKAVLTNPQGEILAERSHPTQDIPGADNSAVWKASVKDLIEAYQQENEIAAIGIASCGIINESHSGVISNGSKLLGIEGLIWQDYLQQEAFVLNDAHAALFAESRLGAGQGYRDLILITLGTGVGGGIMINEQLLMGKLGRAGHLGHVSIQANHQLDIVNTPGSLEDALGECSLQQRSHGQYAETRQLVEDFEKGQAFAAKVWLNSVDALARGIVSFINILSPELIILGGGISRAGDSLMRPLKSFLDHYEWRPNGFETPIEFAKLGNHAGAIGAALFAWEKTNKK